MQFNLEKHNWLFQSSGDIDIWAPKWFSKLQCKYFDHLATWDPDHCDRCMTCLAHKIEDCGA